MIALRGARLVGNCPLFTRPLLLSSSFSFSTNLASPRRRLSIPTDLKKKKAFFASDNAASVHPDIFSSLSEVVSTQEECVGYGFDTYTAQAKATVRDFFECRSAQVEFVYGGTGGNMCVMTLLRKGEAIAASTCAHIYDDESGGPEFGGNKIYSVKTTEGKITVENLDEQFSFALDGGFHRAPVKMVSITQPTERGTVYSLDEIQKISKFCQENDLILHMDGARIGNALPHLGCSMAEMTWKSGVDVVTFGGTKHGLMYGEAVVFFNDKIQTPSFIRLQKMMGQKSSKERFIAAQFKAMVSNSYLKTTCTTAAEMASLLQSEISRLNKDDLSIYYPVEANVLFLHMSPPLLEHLQNKFEGVDEWGRDREGEWVEVRVMTSYSTTKEKVLEFVNEIEDWYEKSEN